MPQSSKPVTIAVVGDARVGKTSLISTLVSGIFPSTVPSVLQQVLLAPEESATAAAAEQGVLIVDTSSEESEREHLFTQILPQADVVVVVFDLGQMETFDQLAPNWLNRLATLSPCLPVVLVGNKTDLSTGDSVRECKRVLERFPNVDSIFMDCSAKTNIHVSDVFYFAQHCVLFPVPALMDVKSGALTPNFTRALGRIFRFYDEDHDGALSDVELNTFQEENFGCRLQKDDLEAIKQVLQKGTAAASMSAEQTSDGTSFQGFCYLFTLFLRRNRAETVWQVLKRFGYSNKRDLSEFTSQTILPKNGGGMELTKRGLAFLANCFHQFDRDGDGVLNQAELSLALGEDKTAVSRKDFDAVLTSQGGNGGDVPLSGWLSFWALEFALHPPRAVRAMEYLGFPELNLALSAIKPLASDKRTGRETKINKTVLRACVFTGAEEVGESAASKFMSALIRKPVSPSTLSVCGMVRSLDPSATHSSLFLILTRSSSSKGKGVQQQSISATGEFDLCVLLFDATVASVERLERIQAGIPSAIPCVYLQDYAGSGSDEGEAAMDAAKKLCQAYSLPEPTRLPLAPPAAQSPEQQQQGEDELAAWTAQMDKTFALYLQTALYPNCARPMSAEALARQKQERVLRSIARITLVCTVLGGLTWAALRVLKRPASQREE